MKQKKGDFIIFDDYSTDFPDIVRFINEIREDDVYDIKIISSARIDLTQSSKKNMKIAIEKYPLFLMKK